MPWRLSSHGTIVRSRASRAVAVSWAKPAISGHPPVRGQRTAQAPDHGVDQLRRLLGDDVGAVARDLLGEVLEVVVVDVDQVPLLVDLPDGAGPAAQAVSRAPARPEHRRARLGLRRGDAGDHELGLVVGGTSNAPGRPAVRTAPTMRERRKTRGAAVDVEGVEVPVAVPRDERPRLHVPLPRLGRLGAPVGEAQRHAPHDTVLDRVERRLRRAQPGLDADEGVDVALDAGGAQLAQGLGRRAGQARLRPRAAREPSTASSSGSKAMSGRAYSRWSMR